MVKKKMPGALILPQLLLKLRGANHDSKRTVLFLGGCTSTTGAYLLNESAPLLGVQRTEEQPQGQIAKGEIVQWWRTERCDLRVGVNSCKPGNGILQPLRAILGRGNNKKQKSSSGTEVMMRGTFEGLRPR